MKKQEFVLDKMLKLQQNLTISLKIGILLEDTSSAVILQNNINKNIKANIALGGDSQINTYIIGNQITGSVNEGIYITKSGQLYIARNFISNNNDGIVCHQAMPQIISNQIEKNKSNGILVLNFSKPKIKDNVIQDNDGVGLLIRQKSKGEIVGNKISINEINLAIEYYYEGCHELIIQNSIDDDYQIPEQNKCTIF